MRGVIMTVDSVSTLNHHGSWTDAQILWKQIARLKVKNYVLNHQSDIYSGSEDLIMNMSSQFAEYLQEILPNSLSENYDILFFEVLKALETRYNISGNKVYSVEFNTNLNKITVALTGGGSVTISLSNADKLQISSNFHY